MSPPFSHCRTGLSVTPRAPGGSSQLERSKRQAADAEAAARSTEGQVRELAKADSRAERERKAVEAEVGPGSGVGGWVGC